MALPDIAVARDPVCGLHQVGRDFYYTCADSESSSYALHDEVSGGDLSSCRRYGRALRASSVLRSRGMQNYFVCGESSSLRRQSNWMIGGSSFEPAVQPEEQVPRFEAPNPVSRPEDLTAQRVDPPNPEPRPADLPQGPVCSNEQTSPDSQGRYQSIYLCGNTEAEHAAMRQQFYRESLSPSGAEVDFVGAAESLSECVRYRRTGEEASSGMDGRYICSPSETGRISSNRALRNGMEVVGGEAASEAPGLARPAYEDESRTAAREGGPDEVLESSPDQAGDQAATQPSPSGEEESTIRPRRRPGEDIDEKADEYLGSTCSGMATEERCMVCNCYWEARGESYEGKVAVGKVVQTRRQYQGRPETMCGVIQQPSQFSWWNPGQPEKNRPMGYKNGRQDPVEAAALRGCISASEEAMEFEGRFATHYHADYVNPSWASQCNYSETIGSHLFYSDCPWERRRHLRMPANVPVPTPRPDIAVSAGAE